MDDPFDDSDCPYCHPEIVAYESEPRNCGLFERCQTSVQINGETVYMIVDLDRYVFDIHYHSGAATQGSFARLGTIQYQTHHLQEFKQKAGKMQKLGPAFQRKLQSRFTTSSSVQTIL